jgi:hypothetical protein
VCTALYTSVGRGSRSSIRQTGTGQDKGEDYSAAVLYRAGGITIDRRMLRDHAYVYVSINTATSMRAQHSKFRRESLPCTRIQWRRWHRRRSLLPVWMTDFNSVNGSKLGVLMVKMDQKGDWFACMCALRERCLHCMKACESRMRRRRW